MASLFFEREYATRIEYDDGVIRITQYEGDSCDVEVGLVVLTRHQFDDLCDMAKVLLTSEK